MTVNLTWEIEEGVPVALEVVVVDHASSSSGSRRGHPDTWAPGWVELEVLEIRNARGCKLPAAVVGKLCANDRFMQAVETEIKGE